MDQDKAYYENRRTIEEVLGITIGDSTTLTLLVEKARLLRTMKPGIIFQSIAAMVIEAFEKPTFTPFSISDYFNACYGELHEEVSLASALENHWLCCHVTTALFALLIMEAGLGFVEIRAEHITDGRDPYVWAKAKWKNEGSPKLREKPADMYAMLVGNKTLRDNGGVVLTELKAT